jgi:acetoin utilization deacetylase AcuC-like enzyme
MSERLLASYHPTFLDHDTGSGHPESADRLRAIRESLLGDPPQGLEWATPETAPAAALLRVHRPEYLELLERLRGRRGRLDPDTFVSERSVEAAYLAAGAALQVVDAVLSGDALTGLALVRPPGHHAEPDRAMGFCLLANAAIAAAHAIESRGVERVLLVDWDVHHGNGIQNAFAGRRDVLYFSAHRGNGFYPGTGALDEVGSGEGAGYTVNAPLPPGCGDALYADLFRRLLVPVAASFRPDLVLVSAGFDAHEHDPLGDMAVTAEGFGQLGAIVREVADRWCEGRLALVLEGGYDLAGLVASLRFVLEAAQRHVEVREASPSPAERAVVDELCAAHRGQWPEVGAAIGAIEHRQ